MQSNFVSQSQHYRNIEDYLKGTNVQKYNQSGRLKYVVKYEVRTFTKSLSKHHCYCPILLMQTTKTAVCLQTKAIYHHLYGF